MYITTLCDHVDRLAKELGASLLPLLIGALVLALIIAFLAAKSLTAPNEAQRAAQLLVRGDHEGARNLLLAPSRRKEPPALYVMTCVELEAENLAWARELMTSLQPLTSKYPEVKIRSDLQELEAALKEGSFGLAFGEVFDGFLAAFDRRSRSTQECRAVADSCGREDAVWPISSRADDRMCARRARRRNGQRSAAATTRPRETLEDRSAHRRG